MLLLGPGLRGQKRHAREDGIPTLLAGHLSPPPRFDVYRAVSAQIMAIFKSITVLVEPLNMDEAYLEITSCVSDFQEALQLACTAAEKENIWASSWVCSGVSSCGRERVNQMMRRTENTSCEVDCQWVAQRAAKGKPLTKSRRAPRDAQREACEQPWRKIRMAFLQKRQEIAER